MKLNVTVIFLPGTYGAGISIVGSEKDKKLLDEIQEKCNTSVKPLPGIYYAYF